MLFLITILAVLAAVGVIAYFTQRRGRQSLPESNFYSTLPPENLRPLFLPTEEEMRKEEAARETALRNEENRFESEKKLAKLAEVRQNWLESYDRKNTVELLYRASQCETGEAYFDTCFAVIEAWRAGKIADLTDDDLAQLLESHFWLLPADERTPGVTFRLNGEIADLRRASVENK